MKFLTLRLGQFSISALLLTILFRYALSLSIGAANTPMILLCAIGYLCLMALSGWYFGGKDVDENDIHDIGFRFHLVTYVLCVGCRYASEYIGWDSGSLKVFTIAAISWGIGLLIHFVFFLIEQKNTIKGYAKEDIFQ